MVTYDRITVVLQRGIVVLLKVILDDDVVVTKIGTKIDYGFVILYDIGVVSTV